MRASRREGGSREGGGENGRRTEAFPSEWRSENGGIEDELGSDESSANAGKMLGFQLKPFGGSGMAGKDRFAPEIGRAHV